LNLNNLSLQEALKKTGLENLRDAVRKDDLIIPAILDILRFRLRACKPDHKSLKEAAYPYIRASKDGAQLELEWLINILTDGE